MRVAVVFSEAEISVALVGCSWDQQDTSEGTSAYPADETKLQQLATVRRQLSRDEYPEPETPRQTQQSRC